MSQLLIVIFPLGNGLKYFPTVEEVSITHSYFSTTVFPSSSKNIIHHILKICIIFQINPVSLILQFFLIFVLNKGVETISIAIINFSIID